MFETRKKKVIEFIYWVVGLGCPIVLMFFLDPVRGWLPYGAVVLVFIWGVAGRYSALASLRTTKQEMSKKAMIDESTGVLSRARVLDALCHEVKAGKRKQEKLTIILIEAVNIMEINHAFDRSEGDACLSAVAMASQACMRETDYLGRSSGLIFCAILPGANMESSGVVRDRMIMKIKDIARSHPKGEVHVKFRTTMCQWDDAENHMSLISRAELLMRSEDIFESSGHGYD